jgi:ribosomal protein L11 methyltransferase
MVKRPIPPWWQLELQLDATIADDAAALLVAAGAQGAELVDSAPGGTDTLVRATYPGTLTDEEVKAGAALALAELGVPWPTHAALTKRADDDWAERWKEGLKPLQVGRRLWVVPTWEKGFVQPADATVIRLDPGMAFGTGQHATTALCLGAIDSLMPPGADPPALLDVGCGTGVLAIAGALLGAERVVAIDNDPIAVLVARENAERNHVVADVDASERALETLTESFGLVVANILAPTLVEMAPDLVRVTAADGRLILSGVLESQASEVTAAVLAAAGRAARTGFRLLDTRRKDEWVALTYGKT